jgi:hypothetical protein
MAKGYRVSEAQGTGETVKLEQQLAGVAARWRKLLPAVPVHPPIPAGTDPTTAEAATGMAHWPATHAALAAQREVAADALVAAAGATVTNLTGGDQENAAGFEAVDD